MRTLTAKKTSLIAVITAVLMVFCVFAVSVSSEDTTADSAGSSNSMIPFGKEDLMKITAVNAISDMDTPFSTYTYNDSDAYSVTADMNASAINAAIGSKTVLVIENAVVTLDAEIGVSALVLKNGASFKSEQEDNIGKIVTEKVVIGEVVIASVKCVSVTGSAKVTVGTTEKLDVTLHVSENGLIKFDSKDGLRSYTINGKGDSVIAAEYKVSFDATPTYGDTYGTPAIDLLLKLTDKEPSAGNFSVSLKIADLKGEKPQNSQKFFATGLELSMSNSNSGEDTENSKLTYKLGEYNYIEIGNNTEVSSKLKNFCLTIDATEQGATGEASFEDLYGTALKGTNREQLSTEDFDAKMTLKGKVNILNLVTLIDGGPEGIDLQKIYAEKLIPDFVIEFDTKYLSYRTESTEANNTTEFSLSKGHQNITMDDGVLHIVAGKEVGNEIQLNRFIGDYSLNAMAETFSAELNINVYSVIKYILDHRNDKSENDVLELLISLMNDKTLQDAKFSVEATHIMIKSWTSVQDKIPEYSELKVDFKGSPLSLNVEFDESEMHINMAVPTIKVKEYYVYNGTTSSESGENQNITETETRFKDISFEGRFKSGAIQALDYVIPADSRSASALDFANVVAYLHTVLRTEESVSDSTLQLNSLYFKTVTTEKYNGTDVYNEVVVDLKTSAENQYAFKISHTSDSLTDSPNTLTAKFGENARLVYTSYKIGKGEVDCYSTMIDGFKIENLNRNTFDTRNFTFTVKYLGAAATETENSKAYFVVLQDAVPKLSLTDIEGIIKNGTPLYKTALGSEPTVYFKSEGYNGEVQTKGKFPMSICYDHFDKTYHIEYKLADADKVTLIPEDVDEKTLVAAITVDGYGNISIDTEGQDHSGNSFKVFIREKETDYTATIFATAVTFIIVLGVAVAAFAFCKKD